MVHPRPSCVINFLVLIVKQMIYKFRCLKIPLNTMQIKTEIDQIYELESNIAFKKDRLRFHSQKWSCIKEVDDDSINNTTIEQYIEEM